MPQYNNVAVALHWLIGLAVIGMVCSGFAMDFIQMEASTKGQIMGLHKSTGVILLFAVTFRILWRFISIQPAFPSAMKAWEKTAAKRGHLGLYIMMISMPVSGYLMSSAGNHPLRLYGLFDVPKLNLSGVYDGIGGVMHTIHVYGAWVIAALIIGHIGAVIYHYIFENINLLPRVWFGRR